MPRRASPRATTGAVPWRCCLRTASVRRPRFIDPFQPADVRRLVGAFGSPLVILGCARGRVPFRKLRKALPGFALHYALTPLPHPAVVQTGIEPGRWLEPPT